MNPDGWQLIVPVKAPPEAKSRLGGDVELARAIAIDTIAAAARTPEVARVTVVTADDRLAWSLGGAPNVSVLQEDEPTGIAAAIAYALDFLGDAAPRAVLLGDLPALRPEDLGAALQAASRLSRAFVSDREGGGTTLVTASAEVELLSRFGPGSAVRHAALGIVRLQIPPESTLRRDVDTPDQLDAAALLGLGPATQAALAPRDPLDPLV